MIEFFVHLIAVLVGLIGISIYFRSIVRVMLLNHREGDLIELCVRTLAVRIVHAMARGRGDYEVIQRSQAWTLPIFIFLAVGSWFLLVQISFSFVLWGLGVEPYWPRAVSSSGSALSTLGYLTPPTLLGEYLAIFEAAIGLAIVIMIFSFVPGYLSAVQIRERKVGWLFVRTGRHPSCKSLLEALEKSGNPDNSAAWEEWESWFRGIYETHSLAPILAHVPSVYRGTSWVSTAAAVLDTASLLLSTLDRGHIDATRICQETGSKTIQIVASELGRKGLIEARDQPDDLTAFAGFDQLYKKLFEMGLPLNPDKDGCRKAFLAYRAEYAPAIREIASQTLMPLADPW